MYHPSSSILHRVMLFCIREIHHTKTIQTQKIQRRRFLQGTSLVGSSLLFPWISRSHAQDNQIPKRLIVVHHPQGHSLQHCIPATTGNNFAMPFALQPLEQFSIQNVDFIWY